MTLVKGEENDHTNEDTSATQESHTKSRSVRGLRKPPERLDPIASWT